MTIQSTIDAIGRSLSNLASTVNNAFGITSSSSDPYHYDDQPFLAGNHDDVYDLTPMSGILGRSGTLELGGWSHISERNVLDGYTLGLQSNNLADNANPAKNAFWFVDRYGNAPGAINADITGNGKANLIVGTDGVNRLNGNNGGDVLLGRRGNDTLDGGTGNDKLTGGYGNDTMNGGAGIDEYHGGAGNDLVIAAAGDEVWTGAGADTIRAGNVRLGIVRNFDPISDHFDLADANEGHYRATNVSGLTIFHEDEGWIVGWGVDTDAGKFTMTHASNGFSSVVTLDDAGLWCGSQAEALEVKANPLSWAGADDWIV